MISFITALAPILGKVLSAKIPATGQTVKGFVTSKTNNLAGISMGYGITLLTANPDNVMGHIYMLASLFAWTIRDSISKIKK